MAKTKIEWVTNPDGTKGSTWNPIGLVGGGHGCTKISEGCLNCYAEKISHHWWNTPPYDGRERQFELRRHILEQPLKRKKPTVYFVQSMSDLFHSQIPVEFIDAIWSVMARCPQHIFLVLTKQPKRMKGFVDDVGVFNYDKLHNVYLGVSVENQKWADIRIPIMLLTPTHIRFVSCEPLLERIEIPRDCLRWLSWLIIGCESGQNRRNFEYSWARQIINDCKSVSVPVFVKQIPVGGKVSKNMDEWPEDLRVREYPEGR